MAIGLSMLVSFAACDNGATGPSDDVTFVIDFAKGEQGWVAGFADYPVGQDDFFELESDYRALSSPLDMTRQALYISGNNHSDDLFMFFKGQVGGLEPGATYRSRFEVEIATPVPQGCGGIGGAPGESVFVKAGASEGEPLSVDQAGEWRLNIDKGNQANGGESAAVLGNVANSRPCDEGPGWETKSLTSGSESIEVTADVVGSAWLLVGTDSGFEGTTSVYLLRVVAIFGPT